MLLSGSYFLIVFHSFIPVNKYCNYDLGIGSMKNYEIKDRNSYDNQE